MVERLSDRISSCVKLPTDQTFKLLFGAEVWHSGPIILGTCGHAVGPFRFQVVKLHSGHWRSKYFFENALADEGTTRGEFLYNINLLQISIS